MIPAHDLPRRVSTAGESMQFRGKTLFREKRSRVAREEQRPRSDTLRRKHFERAVRAHLFSILSSSPPAFTHPITCLLDRERKVRRDGSNSERWKINREAESHLRGQKCRLTSVQRSFAKQIQCGEISHGTQVKSPREYVVEKRETSLTVVDNGGSPACDEKTK